MMKEAGLSFTAPWGLSQAASTLQFTTRQARFLAAIECSELREQVKDYIQCRSIRFDIWSRDGAVPSLQTVLERLEHIRLVPVKPLKDFVWVASGSAGDFDLDRAAFGPILDRLAGGEPVAISALSRTGDRCLSQEELLMLIAILVDHDWVQPVRQGASDIDAACTACRAVNTRMLALQAEGKPMRALASPVTGAGVKMPARHFAFLRARRAGASSPAEYAQFAASEPQSGQSEAQSLAQLTPEAYLADARAFESHALPIYQKLLLDWAAR
jgi:hypothetical protein